MSRRLIFPNKFNTDGGYVAMMSVLIISAIGTLIATSLLIVGMSSMQNSFTLQQSFEAGALADACVNVALEQIRLDATYLGNENFNFETGDCDILPVEISGSNYTISIQGMVDDVVRKNSVIVSRVEDIDTLVVTMTLISWQSVADF